ncbi:AMMECR1 domain containing protein [Marine Group I thaumarchaeote SCGC AAA799-B03]|uniref:Protein AAA799B03_00881 n=2 Tax=Marine Group I TaxID=905826 RepID=A0A087S7B0_9ARCH|nr:AMMECR1 domain containing protein [Marine Group I thaumarchaeote SCGC AAA799-D11]KFM21614.1 AMMECR1 domain containing protein [Marine Group I thaumarchaeote SCGC AAA799-B03]
MINFQFSDSDGIELVKMARKVVTEFLKNNSKISDSEFDSKFDFSSGVFVTLNKEDDLRGCIGYPTPVKKLSDGLIDAAISAATRDPRFSPVTIDELDKITFEVTVLTPPEEIKVEEYSEYLPQIKVGRDGLIVENDFSSGLLLPQVPTEYGWNEEEFLEYTCQKAGLNKNAWKEKSTKISKFQGVIFKEENPNGNIIRESSNDLL